MDNLQKIVVAEPSEAAATQIISETERLAKERFVARNADDALRLVAQHKPELLLLSLELRPDASAVVTKLRKDGLNTCIVGMFRELGVPAMNRLAKAGVDEFLPQPIDYTQLFRLASARFDMHFRRHSRYNVTLDVFRPDGVLVGRTLDVSEGGLRLECFHPAEKDASMLYDIALPKSKLRARCLFLQVDGAAPSKVIARVQFQNLRGEEHRRLIDYMGELSRIAPETA
jgi:DNA-binding response OmpR family regulator